MTSNEIPDYAKNEGGQTNWLKAGKELERTSFYKSQYEKEKVKLEASQKLATLFENVETKINLSPQKISQGDTLSKFILRSFKSEGLMWQGLKNLQEQSYQVDWFPAGYTVEVVNNRLSIYKQTPEGKTYFVSPETDVPVQDLKLFDVSPQVAQADEPEPAVLPTENPILEERWSYVLEEVQTSLGEGFTLETVKKASSPSGLDRTLRIVHGGEVAEVSIVHQTGRNPEQAFSSDVLTVTYKGVSYPTVGRAAYAASLDLKPEPAEAPAFSVDEALPLIDQWNLWKTEIAQMVVTEGMSVDFKNEDSARIKFTVHHGKRKESVIIQRYLTAKNGGYTNKDAEITYGEHTFKDPLIAVKAVITDLKLPKKKLKVTMPWEKHEHEDEEDSHDGHAH